MNPLSDAVAQAGHAWNTIATFVYEHQGLGVVLLTILVCAVGWECTHPQEEGKHHV
jgi:hypothetical protein